MNVVSFQTIFVSFQIWGIMKKGVTLQRSFGNHRQDWPAELAVYTNIIVQNHERTSITGNARGWKASLGR